jgi:hypothetical protein
MTRDELVGALRLHRAEIVEAEEWRPLADHVLALVNMGILRAAYTEPAEIETARGVLLKVRETLEEQLEQQRQHVGDPTWKQPEETRTEIGAINVSRLALDALAREPVLQADLEQITELRDSAEEALQQKQETIDGISAGIINPPSLETVLKLIQLEKRERLLVGLLRLVANEAVCECDDPDDDDANPLTCALLHPSTPGDWCPVCIVRKSLESDKPGPA